MGLRRIPSFAPKADFILSQFLVCVPRGTCRDFCLHVLTCLILLLDQKEATFHHFYPYTWCTDQYEVGTHAEQIKELTGLLGERGPGMSLQGRWRRPCLCF